MNTIETKLINEFMGIRLFSESEERKQVPAYFKPRYYERNKEKLYILGEGTPNWTTKILDDFNYETFWEIIMPVVEKAEGFGANIIIGRFFCEIKYQHPLNQDKSFEVRMACGIKIKAVYSALIQFIEWYNINK